MKNSQVRVATWERDAAEELWSFDASGKWPDNKEFWLATVTGIISKHAENVEQAAQAAALELADLRVLEQRCERDTPYDIGVMEAHKAIRALITSDQRTALQAALDLATMAEHKSHIEFESELYATMVDPVASGTIREAEMRYQLLEAARSNRQALYDAQNGRVTALDAARLPLIEELEGLAEKWHNSDRVFGSFMERKCADELQAILERVRASRETKEQQP